MRKYLSTLICFFVFCGISNARQNDTIKSKVLNEVVVEGRSQRTVKNGVEYTPGKRMKKAALDAASLLLQMQIPMLRVSPGSSAIKTLAGQDVAVYIDFVPASQQDMTGLRPEDVMRVEVLEYPEDPRFKGASHVVNFRMRKYLWGGYTKFTLYGNELNMDSYGGTVYSKFNYKKWTFDASADGSYTLNTRGKDFSSAIFRDVKFNGVQYDELTRKASSAVNNFEQSNSQWASFRATYNNGRNISGYHTVSFQRSGMPDFIKRQNVEYSDNIFPNSHSFSRESSRTLSPKISVNYWFYLPDRNTLSVSGDFGYAYTRRNSIYDVSGLSAIENNNRERVYTPNLQFYYNKGFKHNNSLSAMIYSVNHIYHTDYSGSYIGLQKLWSSENFLWLEYRQNWKNGLNLFARAGMNYVLGRVNGVNEIHQWSPRAGFNLQYRPNFRHITSIDAWYDNSFPSSSTNNDAFVRSNELLWLQGNPDLKTQRSVTSSASYTFIPANVFSMSANFRYEGTFRRFALDYYSMPGYDGLIRKFVNSGNRHSYRASVSASLRLLNNSLALSAAGNYTAVRMTGLNCRNMHNFSGSFNVNYYFRDFSFMLFYNTPEKMIHDIFTRGSLNSYKSIYGFYMTYAKGDFKASLQFNNWFSGKPYIYSDFISSRYAENGWSWNSQLARSISINLTYTLPYGKKVDRNNELQEGGSIDSAILK